MTIVHAVLVSAVLFAAGLPVDVHAADPACLKRLEDSANRDRRRGDLYLGEMKNLAKVDTTLRAQDSVSVCSGALARAEQFYKRHLADQSLCGIGSSYVDNQVPVLFKNAQITCHSEWEDLVRAMPPEEQRILSERVNRRAAELR